MGIRVIDLDIHAIKLDEFLKAMGYEQVKTDGQNQTFKAPEESPQLPVCIVDTLNNQWSTPNGEAYGGIYDLAYEMTGSCDRSELNMFIAGEMSKVQEVKMYDVTVGIQKQKPVTPKPEAPKAEPPKPKRRMRR